MKPSHLNASEAIETKRKKLKAVNRRNHEGRAPKSSGVEFGVPSIELFQKEECPFSHNVRSRLTELGLDFIAHNVPSGNMLKHKQLVQAGGKDQVPFLIDHATGVRLYESSAIITYLNSEYGDPSHAKGLSHLSKKFQERLALQQERFRWTMQRPRERAEKLTRMAGDAWQTMRGSARLMAPKLTPMVSSMPWVGHWVAPMISKYMGKPEETQNEAKRETPSREDRAA